MNGDLERELELAEDIAEALKLVPQAILVLPWDLTSQRDLDAGLLSNAAAARGVDAVWVGHQLEWRFSLAERQR